MVVTVGTFDGVHCGHRQVLQIVEATAIRLGLPSALVTFDPHPLAVVRPEQAPPLLTTGAEKIELIADSLIDYVVILRFDRTLANYAPRRFVEEILIGRVGMRHLVIGHDHGFGRGRSGDVATLREIGDELGFAVDVVEPVQEGGQAVSSSRIRRALERGDVEEAARCLGREYTWSGRVVAGDGRGRDLGFPTANLEAGDASKLVPGPGIYAVRGTLGSRTVDGVMHIGPRPTFPGSAATLELHLLDFDEDLYGKTVGVRFHARLRDVARFESVAALVTAMAHDVVLARSALRGSAGRGYP
jgi:riboflavin kinase/FMN adenylyltransferase